MENIILNNKLECPVIGIGTFMLSPAEAENSVREALKMGYSLVDTANAYVNERACGRGIRESGLKREEARLHPDKNIITRAIGAMENVEVDFFTVELNPTDKILMCSDGLTNMVEDRRILEILNKFPNDKTLVETAHALIDEANENGGKDNIGVVLVRPYSDEVNKE